MVAVDVVVVVGQSQPRPGASPEDPSRRGQSVEDRAWDDADDVAAAPPPLGGGGGGELHWDRCSWL